MDETVNNEEHSCRLFTGLDQLKSIEDNDTSIQTNIEQGGLFTETCTWQCLFGKWWEKIIEGINMLGQIQSWCRWARYSFFRLFSFPAK